MIGSISRFRKSLLRWYRAHRRDLPWRTASGSPPDQRPDPYAVLVSETMLQQTRVTTVLPYFRRFMAELPTLHDLAAADEQQILRLWQGLGYYARARNLHRAAKLIVERFGGKIPADVATLRTLPGVGRYTAGAVASLAFGRPEPVLDGNVARVLCRLDRITTDPRSHPTSQRLWKRAAALVPEDAPGDFNSALMELGATICTARSPACLVCPVSDYCETREAGETDRIPPPRATRPTPLVRRKVVCVVPRGSCQTL
ncbi:MAG: A/G-specific adenine glycosylase, partial [Phycisphaerae bacterium]|nr:A/G-specific adenine glycosylase [Phycisphaerae bacterium]MDW8263305.1 A/G-specific adenine glycosylase [Phycisphaerales bacterium]